MSLIFYCFFTKIKNISNQKIKGYAEIGYAEIGSPWHVRLFSSKF